MSVSAGAYHSVAVTNDGRAYVWGWNTVGQLGLGPLFPEPVLTSPEPARFFLEGGPAMAVTEVACGYDYTIVRTAAGRLYGFGSNSEGQLGLGDRQNRDVPVAISLLDPRGAQARNTILFFCSRENNMILTLPMGRSYLNEWLLVGSTLWQ